MTNKSAMIPAGAPQGGAAEAALPPQLRLWQFMAGHTARYVSGESTSVPQETADELLASALYTMGLDAEDPKLWDRLPEDLDGAYRAGVRRLERKIAVGKRLSAAALQGAEKIPCKSLSDTISSIARGWRQYDFRWFAREFPADMDYQLCLSVPETLAGVDYINEYLRRILIELDFLHRLDAAACTVLLDCVLPNWRALVCNLYEVAAAGALGAALTGGEVRLVKTNASALENRLEMRMRSQLEEQLRLGAERAADALNMQNAAARRYLTETAAALVPRISAALDSGNLSCMFPEF